MKFRFVAVTEGGELRTGYVDAVDEDSVRTQLTRRRLTPQEITRNFSEAPVHTAIKSEPLEQAPPPLEPLSPFRLLTQVDWRKVAVLFAMLALVVGSSLWGLFKIFGDKVYHLRISGTVHIKSRKKNVNELHDKVQMYVWFSKSGIAVDKGGAIWVRNGKDWHKRLGKAKVVCKWGNEGLYDLDIQVPLPSAPLDCVVAIQAPGFKRVTRSSMFAVKDNVLKADLPAVVLRGRRPTKGRRLSPPKKRAS
ncbi:hypothetical protein IV102_02580 [bacterium]|nr:hypothetical protein [bacterium]